ncbi:hypothetical protein BU17DRAFT_85723 [Hysterangium stoloniferum]|nr:hypothetical protein BU17DRAFT_85723 [Hysterangium stoloniferum]
MTAFAKRYPIGRPEGLFTTTMLSTLLVVLTALDLVVCQSAQPVLIANCSTASWTNNADHQSPCMVASALVGACGGGAAPIAPLLPGNDIYTGPSNTASSNKCSCSSVTYSMFSACSICQNGTVGQWSGWISNCIPGDISVASFPLSIPTTVTVPAWAYMDVSKTGVFDANAAELTANAGTSPDSSAGPVPTSTATPPSSTGPASASSSPSSTPFVTSHHNNAGPIAGGVVGGLLAISLLIGGFLYFRHRRSPNRNARGDRVEEYIVTHPFDGGDNSVANGGGGEKSQLGVREVILPGFSYKRVPAPKLYDPDDPSTFPPTPHPSLPGFSMTDSSMTDPRTHVRTLSDDSMPGHSQGPFSPTITATTSNSITTQSLAQSHGRNLSDGTTGAISAIPEI